MTEQLSQARIAKLHDVFAMFDTNEDGFIGFTELKDLMISLGKSPSEEEVRIALKSIDQDEDGSINFAEFLNLVGKNPRLWEEETDSEMQQLFKMFDRDRDGYVTHEEIKRALEQMGDSVTHKEVQEMIAEADTDGDGKLTFEEFESVINKCQGKT